jgi:hypothetical protein
VLRGDSSRDGHQAWLQRLLTVGEAHRERGWQCRVWEGDGWISVEYALPLDCSTTDEAHAVAVLRLVAAECGIEVE